jgi:hypothetical protein
MAELAPGDRGVPKVSVPIGDRSWGKISALAGLGKGEILVAYAAPGLSYVVHLRGRRARILASTGVKISALWASDRKNVYAVSKGRVLHLKGRRWRCHELISGGWLEGIWGTGSNNILAAGAMGTIAHYDGKEWLLRNSGSKWVLRGVHGSGPNNVFAVGHAGTITRFDGKKWTEQAGGGSPTHYLSGVWVNSPTNAWAVGKGNSLKRWDGKSWRSAEGYVCGHGLLALKDVWASGADQVAAVGERGIIMLYDGKEWTEGTLRSAGDLRAVWGRSSKEVYVADSSTVYRFNGRRWQRVLEIGSRSQKKFEMLPRSPCPSDQMRRFRSSDSDLLTY